MHAGQLSQMVWMVMGSNIGQGGCVSMSVGPKIIWPMRCLGWSCTVMIIWNEWEMFFVKSELLCQKIISSLSFFVCFLLNSHTMVHISGIIQISPNWIYLICGQVFVFFSICLGKAFVCVSVGVALCAEEVAGWTNGEGAINRKLSSFQHIW